MSESGDLSRICVHLEQNLLNGRYLNTDDIIGLSQTLADAWTVLTDGPGDTDRRIERNAQQGRKLEFGKTYLDVLNWPTAH